MIKVKLTETAKQIMLVREDINFLPYRATNGSAGFDLRACIGSPVTLKPGDVFKFPTGVCIWLDNLDMDIEDIVPAGLYLPRSSNPGLTLVNTVGLLDSDYQNESFLKYRNDSNEDITIDVGEKIGQLVIFGAYVGVLDVREEFDIATARKGGFGHSGRF